MGKQKGRTTKGAAARVTAAAATAGRGEAQEAIVGAEPPTDTVHKGGRQEEAMDRAEATVPDQKNCLAGTAGDATAAKLEKELHELGGFALDMEEQLLHDLQALLARRRQQKGQEAKLASMDISPRDCDGGSNDALYWKHMYERLKDLRETEAEKLSREVRQHAEQQSKAYNELIAHLKAQLEHQAGGAACQAKQQLDVTAVQKQRQQDQDQQPDPQIQPQPRPPAQQLQQPEHQRRDELQQEHHPDQQQQAQKSLLPPPATGSSELVEARNKIQCLEAKVARLKRQLLGYQRLTSVCLSVESEPDEKATAVEDSVTTLTCTAINHIHKRAVKFQVALNCDHEDILDLDVHFRPLANVNLLPDFLKQEVTLATKQCPLLALSILNMLFEDDGQ